MARVRDTHSEREASSYIPRDDWSELKEFFSNLAMRVLTPEAALRPRLRTPFEAPAATFQSLASQSEDLTQLDELAEDIISQPFTLSPGEAGVERRRHDQDQNLQKRRKKVGRDRSDRLDDDAELAALQATIRSTSSSPAKQPEDGSGQKTTIVNHAPAKPSRSSEDNKNSAAKGLLDRSSARSTNVVTQQKPTPIVPSVSRTERTLVPGNSIERPRRLGEERPRRGEDGGNDPHIDRPSRSEGDDSSSRFVSSRLS